MALLGVLNFRCSIVYPNKLSLFRSKLNISWKKEKKKREIKNNFFSHIFLAHFLWFGHIFPSHILWFIVFSWIWNLNLLEPLVDVLICRFQILPQLLFYFGVSNDVDSLDWATMVVYTCESSCEANVSYKEEFVWVQHSLSSVPWWLSIYLVEEKMFLLGVKFCLNENFVWLF